MKIHVIGCGNPSRGDDGLGIGLAQAVEAATPANVTTDSDYQLNIEHAVDISEADLVIFADASLDASEPFEFRELEPANRIEFSTHSVDAESVLAICQNIYGHAPQAWMLGIRGYSFELGDGLCPKAQRNLESAAGFLLSFLQGRRVGENIREGEALSEPIS